VDPSVIVPVAVNDTVSPGEMLDGPVIISDRSDAGADVGVGVGVARRAGLNELGSFGPWSHATSSATAETTIQVCLGMRHLLAKLPITTGATNL
jgi:hypothetical protein